MARKPKRQSGSKPTRWVREAPRIEALTSLVRQRILDRLEAIGPASVRELAESLGVAPDRLYYHVRALESHEHIEATGERGEGRHREVVYDLVSRDWHIRYEPSDADNVAAVRKLTRAMMRQARRDFETGLEDETAAVVGPLRTLWSLRLEASLDDDELRALNEHLQAIVSLLRKPSRDSGGTLVSFSWLLSPLPSPESSGDD